MLNLHFAPSLDLLMPELLSWVRRYWSDPFKAPDIIVPNPSLGRWLQMRLADGRVEGGQKLQPFGCIANMQLPTIERYLWNLLNPGAIEQIDQQMLTQVIDALLDESLIEEQVFKPVKTYLCTTAGTIDPYKRVQLSSRIAHRLLEYEYNRPGVCRAPGKWEPDGIDGRWMAGKRYTNDTESEPWQAELYRRARACLAAVPGERGNQPKTCLTLPQLYRLRRDKGVENGDAWTVAPTEVAIFGVNSVSHFHRNLFVELSQMEGVELQVFLTNPCAEFWEDVNTSRRHIVRFWNSSSETTPIPPRKRDDYDKEELRDLDGVTIPEDHTLLALWGAAGKENVFLWCQDAQWNFNYQAPAWIDEERTPESLLVSLQQSLLRREHRLQPALQQNEHDQSLQILACPDRGREIEEIREQILDCIQNRTITMLNEVVVYLTDPLLYLPSIQRVFGKYAQYDPEYIPFCILGMSGSETLFAEGVKALFALMQHRFDRAHVFTLLRNPIVQTTRRISADLIPLWEQWAEELSIFRGFDREHRKEMGDTGKTVTDAHTFSLGMARMLVADLSEGAAFIDFKECGNDGMQEDTDIPVLPYRDFTTDDRESLELFCATITALYVDSKRLREAVSGHGDGLPETTADLVSRWMGKIPEEGVDGAAEGSALRGFTSSLATIALQRTAVGRTGIPFDEYVALVLGCLPAESASNSGAWSGGITFAPLKTAMVVPHTVVFAAGLDDVLFPGSNDTPSWDLLGKKRIIGDSDPVRDNRFAFLELIHAARKRLVLSYRARDMQKESELHPSSVIRELTTYLTEGENGVFPERTIPWIVHESLLTIKSSGRAHGSWNHHERVLAAIASRTDRKQSRYDLAANVPPPSNTKKEVHTSYYNLRQFFKNPLEYHLSTTLGIDPGDAPDTMVATDEPLGSSALAMAGIYRAIWQTLLHRIFPEEASKAVTDRATLRGIAIAEAQKAYQLHVAAGNAPEAPMEALEREQLLGWAEKAVEPLLAILGTYTAHRVVEKSDMALLRTGVPGELSLTLDSGAAATISCMHSLVLVPRTKSDNRSVALLAIRSKGEAGENPDLWMEGALQWLYEEQCNTTAYTISLLQLNYTDPACSHNVFTSRYTRAAALRHWLDGMLTEMMQQCADHFPFSVVQTLTAPKKGNPLPWNIRIGNVTKEGVEEQLQSEYGYRSFIPAFALVEAVLPSNLDDLLQRIADSRFAPMLDNWLIDEEEEA